MRVEVIKCNLCEDEMLDYVGFNVAGHTVSVADDWREADFHLCHHCVRKISEVHNKTNTPGTDQEGG